MITLLLPLLIAAGEIVLRVSALIHQGRIIVVSEDTETSLLVIDRLESRLIFESLNCGWLKDEHYNLLTG
jgi:hypothetical protein